MDYSTYRALQTSPEFAPGWLLRPRGAAWLAASGGLRDDVLDRLKAAVSLRFATRAPADGLARLGDERVLERSTTDTDATYAARLVDAWNLWHYAGTPFGLLRALYDQGYTGAYLETTGGAEFSLAGTDVEDLVEFELPAGSWACFATDEHWASFAVYFHVNPWGAGVTPAVNDPRVEQIRRLVRTWKPSFAVCTGIFVENAAESWGWPAAHPEAPDSGTWGDAGTWGGATVLRYEP